MAYNRSRSRSRNAKKNQRPPMSPHLPIQIVSAILAAVLTWFRLPGMLVLALGFLVAAKSARYPELTDKDIWKAPSPGNKSERSKLASYRKASAWFAHAEDFKPWRPAFVMSAGIGALLAAFQSNPWLGLAQCLGTALFGAAALSRLREGTGSIPVRGRGTDWAKTTMWWSMGLAVAGLVAAAPIYALSGSLWGCAALPLILPALPLYPAYRAARRQFKRDRETAQLLGGWLETLDKPVVRRPGLLSASELGSHGERHFHLGASDVRAWTDKAARDALRPAAARAGLDVAFVLDGAERNRCLGAIAPLEAIPGAELAADPVGLAVRCDMETARLGFNYATFPAKSKLVEVGHTKDGTPAAYAWSLIGPQPDWARVAADWLRGSTDGELGDWGTLIDLHMLVDPGDAHGWVWAGSYADIEFDERKCAKFVTKSFTADPGMHRYLSLIERNKAELTAWENALKTAKLPEPVSINYDLEETLEGPGWSLRVTPMGVSAIGGFSSADYMKVDLRAGMGDSSVADVLGYPNGPHSWYARWMRFVQSRPVVSPNIPQRIDQVRGDSPAETVLAQVIASRAFAATLKRPAMVSEPTRVSRGSWTMWALPVELTGGVTAADARKAQPRIQAMMGAKVALWQWIDQGHVILWAGDGCPPDPRAWARPAQCAAANRLRLDEAWAAAGATSRDGRSVSTLSYAAADGDLWRGVFEAPNGLSPESAEGKIDAFAANAGFAYTKPVPSDAPNHIALLLCDHDPLPGFVKPDWSLLEDGGRRMPFGVLDDGRIAVWNPKDTPHMLASGTTGSGKSSVSMTIVAAALRLGFDVAVTDPSKGANDFRPIQSKLISFEDTLPGCYALIRWAAAEMRRRVRLISANGGGDLNDLPDDVRPRPLLIQIDEFNSLLQKDRAKVPNPFQDPDVANANTRIDWENGLRGAIGLNISAILTQARSAGIMLLLGAQALKSGDLDLLPQASTAKDMLGRVFLGNGDCNGNVRGVKTGNRLIRQAVASGGMPKGRGLYEPLGSAPDLVQCWFSGTGEDYAAVCADAPDAEQVDLTPYLPMEPELVGVVEEEDAEPVETVSVDLGDDEEWTLD
jgi:hypothetical protein